MQKKLIPGTTLEYTETHGMFKMFLPLIKATDGLTLSQVCTITGLEGSTIQNWVKRKFVANPVNKKYHERQLARILLISSLRESMKLETIGELMSLINGNANDTSDDIISEEQLYDYFCDVIGQADTSTPHPHEVPELVESVIKDYSGPDEKAKERLKSALSVMVYAYTASEYKLKAEEELGRMKKEF
jgi:DNA-binding transcriptional MerR regulator